MPEEEEERRSVARMPTNRSPGKLLSLSLFLLYGCMTAKRIDFVYAYSCGHPLPRMRPRSRILTNAHAVFVVAYCYRAG